jgi:hypothetical protein
MMELGVLRRLEHSEVWAMTWVGVMAANSPDRVIFAHTKQQQRVRTKNVLFRSSYEDSFQTHNSGKHTRNHSDYLRFRKLKQSNASDG